MDKVKVYQFSILATLAAVYMFLRVANSPHTVGYWFSSITAFSMLFGGFLEVATIFALSWLIGVRSSWQRLLFYSIFFLAIVFYLTQCVALLISGEMVSRLAISNIAFISLLPISWWQYLLIIALVLGLTIVLVIWIERRVPLSESSKQSFSTPFLRRVFLLAILGILCIAVSSLPTEGNGLFPATSLCLNLSQVFLAKNPGSPKSASAGEQSLSRKFFRSKVFDRPLTFSTYSKKNRPNIIVFFVEGLPARLVGCYGSIFQGITPHIDVFANNHCCMKVENYYNHTAATFRGITTQNNSGFTTSEFDFDKKRDLPSVVSILGRRGYSTYFFYSQDHEELYKMAEFLHFGHIYPARRIKEELLKSDEYDMEADLPPGITDKGLVTGLISFLNGRKKNDRPFYLAVYTFQTHAFLPSPPHGVLYPRLHNSMLDKVHNLDEQFGRFWKFFEGSSYRDNTILVLTADHTGYSGDRGYAALDKQFGLKLPWFVDRIPLVVYDPLCQLPQSYDARMATSTSFAPTLLHILGIQRANNYFFGKSLFERKSRVGIASIDRNRKYYIYKNSVGSGEPPASIRDDVKLQWSRIDDYYQFHLKPAS